MLKKRILTALILMPLFIFLVVALSPLGFCLFTAALVLLCAWEWSALIGMKNFPRSFVYPLIMLCALFAALWLNIESIMIVAFVWWLFAGFLVWKFPAISDAWGKGVILRSLMGFLVLIPCWLALNYIRNADNGIMILLMLFVLIWGADSGAYFVGKKWGKKKLASAVSPGKTWEGLYGALIVTVCIALAALSYFDVPRAVWPGALVLSVVTVLFSILGDLFESMLKRKENLKDSSQLLPGHGGLLDRIDSLTAAAPIFVLGATWLGKVFH